jgi:Leucine-rich repeat (LRR) protein
MLSFTNIKPSNIQSLISLPEELQQEIAEWTGIFIPFSLNAYHCGFRRFLFGFGGEDDVCLKQPIYINKYYIYDENGKLSKPLHSRFPNLNIIFEKQPGHRDIEILCGRTWQNMSSLKTLDINGANGGNLNHNIPTHLLDRDIRSNVDEDYLIPFELPNEIGQLTQLEQFGVSESSIVSIPKSIGKLTSLKEFWICDNDFLFDVPNEICRLTNLITLTLENLRDNAPRDIANLKNLRNLYLSGPITTIPDLSPLGRRLIVLQLKDTNLEYIPPWIGNMSNLRHLDLSLNNFQFLIPELFTLGKLKYLSLKDTCIEYIPSSISKLTSLTTLDISYNEISYIPSNTFGLLNLSNILLFGNPLTNIPDELMDRIVNNEIVISIVDPDDPDISCDLPSNIQTAIQGYNNINNNVNSPSFPW